MKHRIRNELIAATLCIALFLGIGLCGGNALMPAREGYSAPWDQYLEEPENSIDVLCLGSSLAYCDVLPAAIYAETGITTYVMAGPLQTMSISYYYLKECLKTQSPQVVLLEATSLLYGKYESYTQVNIAHMPYGANRFSAMLHAAPYSSWPGLLFPLYSYHSRWEDVTAAEFFASDSGTDPFAGYIFLSETEPQEKRTERDFVFDQEAFDFNLKYLQKIAALCREEGIALELFISPTCNYISPELMETITQVVEGMTLIDYNADFEDLGLDLQTDFYDHRHLNVTGAQKFSTHLAQHLQESYSLSGTGHDQSLWQSRIAHLEAEIQTAA